MAITEPDFDWLTVEWRRESDGATVARTPSFIHEALETQTLVVSVTDARGGIATDRVTLAVGETVRRDVTHPVEDMRRPTAWGAASRGRSPIGLQT